MSSPTDWQKKLLFTKHDTCGEILQVTFLEKKKRENGKQR